MKSLVSVYKFFYSNQIWRLTGSPGNDCSLIDMPLHRGVVCLVFSPGKVLAKPLKLPRKPATATGGGGPVAKLSSLMTSVVEEMTSSPTSSQSSVTSCDNDVTVATGDEDAEAATDYVFRVVYMSRPDYVGQWRHLVNCYEPFTLLFSSRLVIAITKLGWGQGRY